MSQENVEIVRRGHETFNQRDLDAYLAVHDPDVEFTPYERAIEGLGPTRSPKGAGWKGRNVSGRSAVWTLAQSAARSVASHQRAAGRVLRRQNPRRPDG